MGFFHDRRDDPVVCRMMELVELMELMELMEDRTEDRKVGWKCLWDFAEIGRAHV